MTPAEEPFWLTILINLFGMFVLFGFLIFVFKVVKLAWGLA